MTAPHDSPGETAYDRVEYIAASFPRMSPARMGAVGYLFGLQPASANRCRMLELGCGRGFTLLGLAQIYPESEFHGLDLSVRHVENARRLAERAGLKNVRFEHRSILDISPEKDGHYDYIASHGVYSWVPAEVKRKILEICGTQLTAQGIAYVSYNTLPGWAHLRVIREILIYHTQRYADPLEKFQQARTLVSFLRETAPGGAEGWLGKWLKSVEALLARSDPSYFLHEYLEDTNDPCFFYQFMEQAEDCGLQYVSESVVAMTLPSNLGPQAGKVVEMLKRSIVDAEQYMDFARNTQFRATLLCRKDIALERSWSAGRLRQLLYATVIKPVAAGKNLAEGVAEEFQFGGSSKFSSKQALVKAALHFLSANPAVFLSLPAMLEGALDIMRKENFSPAGIESHAAMGSLCALVDRMLRAGVVEISMSELGAYLPVKSLPEKPLAVPIARVQADEKLPVLRHDLRSEKTTAPTAVLLPFCDGTRTSEELFAVYGQCVEKGSIMCPVPRSAEEPPDLRAAYEEIVQELVKGNLLWKARSVSAEGAAA